MKMYILGASICNLPTPTSTMAKLYSLLLCAFFFVIIGTRHVEAQKVLIETDHGSIMIELYPDSAAITVANFLKYVDGGLFNATKFYRVVRMDNQPNSTIKIEVIQGGMGNDSLKRFMKQPKIPESNILMGHYPWLARSRVRPVRNFSYVLMTSPSSTSEVYAILMDRALQHLAG
jgi:hypothetical protein